MPSKSPAQAKFMRAAAHNKDFAKEAGIPVKVAQEFTTADQRKATAKALRKPMTEPGG